MSRRVNVDKEEFLHKVEQYMIDNKEIIENIKEEVQEKAQSIDLKKALHLNNPKLLASAQLDPETWGMIAMMYIGGQTAVDFAKMWRHGG
jgi:hypothetical protein